MRELSEGLVAVMFGHWACESAVIGLAKECQGAGDGLEESPGDEMVLVLDGEDSSSLRLRLSAMGYYDLYLLMSSLKIQHLMRQEML